MPTLLSRKDFREGVFRRDGGVCVVCGEKAADAHHIVERALWNDEGYYMENGASVCTKHHLLAESNHIPPCVVRRYAGIKDTVVPKSFDPTLEYDKWGKPFVNPTRDDIKYPSTFYLNFSPSQYDEEGKAENVDNKDFARVPLVATIKMDGACCKLTPDYVAARNGSHATKKSFDMLKAMHPSFKYLIPQNVRVFAEWLYKKHSIHYTDDMALGSLLQVFGVYYVDKRIWGSWDEVEAMAATLGFPTVPVISKFEVDTEWEFANRVSKMAEDIVAQGHEGLVVRNAFAFHYGQFGRFMGKYVRANHIQIKDEDERTIIRNETV